jgi:hypothetical protein
MSQLNLVDFTALRNKPQKHNFKKGDVLVLFGELFNRGYANGLVEEAEKNGLTVVRATVGRRDDNGDLRALTAEESASIPKPFINIPLEAGFDLEKNAEGKTPNDYLKGFKLSAWHEAVIPQAAMDEARISARKRFKQNTEYFLKELETIIADNIKAGCHVHFAHLMAGGVPRTKIVMPLMNRVFKGTEDRYLPSKEFMDSSIGEFMRQNFLEVTAETFDTLIDCSTSLRKKLESLSGSASYVAYGYHGTEIVIGSEYRWQSYAPYIQGWAKVHLEDFSKKWFAQGVRTCVYNCPEILTNSSSIFKGVEIPLYNLLRALEKEIPQHLVTKKLRADCIAVLKSEDDLNTMFKAIDDYMIYAEKIGTSQYKGWPQHSQKDQLKETLELSDLVIGFHKDEKVMMAPVLSEVIFNSCGYIMLHDGFNPKHPVAWIGHDIIAKCVEI